MSVFDALGIRTGCVNMTVTVTGPWRAGLGLVWNCTKRAIPVSSRENNLQKNAKFLDGRQELLQGTTNVMLNITYGLLTALQSGCTQ